jgi:hypothetical protein
MIEPSIEPAAESSNEGLDELIDLPSGEGYRIDAANEVTSCNFTNVVLFAGTAECGKTTLLASLYLLIQKAPFAGYSFAVKRTLVGFEKRVHNARVASSLRRPKTERSNVSELLHLRIRKSDRSDASRDLLLCDLWGEDFREARDSIEGCKRLPIIRRADAFVLLVDGAREGKLDFRQQAKSDPISLLRNVLDCEMLAETIEVDIVHTKCDELEKGTDPSEAKAFADHVDEEIRRLFATRVSQLHFARVSAHSLDGSRPLGDGLEPLFTRWVTRKPGQARRRLRMPELPPGASEYDRYYASYLNPTTTK